MRSPRHATQSSRRRQLGSTSSHGPFQGSHGTISGQSGAGMTARAFLDRLFRTGDRGRAPLDLPAAAPAGAAARRPADCAGGRQGRRRHDRSGRATLSRCGRRSGGAPDRPRRHPPWLRAPDPTDRHDRGRPSAARCRRPCGGRSRVLDIADDAGAADLVLVLLSGGASANWIAPAHGLAFADKQEVTRALHPLAAPTLAKSTW